MPNVLLLTSCGLTMQKKMMAWRVGKAVGNVKNDRTRVDRSGFSYIENKPKSQFETVQDLSLLRASVSAFARRLAGRPPFHSRYFPAAAAFFFYAFSGHAVVPPW
jgi:hypothetical protein